MNSVHANQFIVVQHEDCTTPGSTLLWLRQNNFEFKIIRPDLGDIFPVVNSSLKVIICGGIPNVDEEEKFPWLKAEKTWIQDLVKREIPVLGLCLGAQLMAVVLGARVFKSKDWEFGWQSLNVSGEFAQWLKTDPLLQRRVFQCHGYQFDLPSTLKSFGESNATPCQGFYDGKNILGFQFHPEADQNWIDLCTQTSKPVGRFCEPREQIPKSTQAHLSENQKWYFSILNRFFIS